MNRLNLFKLNTPVYYKQMYLDMLVFFIALITLKMEQANSSMFFVLGYYHFS